MDDMPEEVGAAHNKHVSPLSSAEGGDVFEPPKHLSPLSSSDGGEVTVTVSGEGDAPSPAPAAAATPSFAGDELLWVGMLRAGRRNLLSGP